MSRCDLTLNPVVATKVGRIGNPSLKYRCETENCVSFRDGRISNPSHDEDSATLGIALGGRDT